MDRRKNDHLRLVVDRSGASSRIEGLYLVTDEGPNIVERVRRAIPGGVAALQFRHKGSDRAEKSLLGGELRRLAADNDIPFIVNDDLPLALELDADGLHLGQSDGDPAEARQLLGPYRLLGISAHNLDEALAAQQAGADYIGFGAMFPTRSKEIEHLPGPTGLAEVRPHIQIPIVAIGGITRNNAHKVIDSGADSLAVISAVLESRDPFVAASELSLLFNRKDPFPRGSVMTVAGSDSGGGAGIQADLKTITLLGSYGSSVITALTAQNTRGVSAIQGVEPEFVTEQLAVVLSDIPVDVIKTGMLFSSRIIDAVATALESNRRPLLVLDPVMLAKGGTSLIDREAVNCLKHSLLPLAYLITPNIPEAERLSGITIVDEDGMQQAARAIHRLGSRNVLIKGGHLGDGNSVDILFDGSAFIRYPAQRVLTKNTHGTGCTMASAIASFLAQGEPLQVAVGRAKEFITNAIRLSQPLGKGHGPVNHFLAAKEIWGESAKSRGPEYNP
ncbi:thiamine biosynthesis bifunctional protein ThiED [Geobacter sp. OR-1]|uniref:bifunctional hydroxymethylpyrimidine kinase/phosphomethylpyrimidine kinase n=1 Tax=Geobacter sp. OR-1 TaxID=1266765 RepID=UPI000542F270|nr:bifunctional hydroxymethylpyrimidine kinase/phosphomethylpyrimidine kinase [Geobacter sp. OR-1]GAM08959.1 thiamine biosynthesis bifunctional protein ThiED [Geobacter sp. OR-1]